jgi:diphthine-ammonia ligase
MSKPRAAVSWSGGKDCCLAFSRSRAAFEIAGLITMFTEDGSRSRSHGLRPEVLKAQAEALGLPLLTARASWSVYEAEFQRLLARARAWNITHVIFGDIYPDAHKEWAERVCKHEHLIALEPLWAEPTEALVGEFISEGGKATIVAVCRSELDSNWLGQPIDPERIKKLQALGVDPCGERGEFHTLVTFFPGFQSELRFQEIGRLEHGGCFMLDLLPY